jgi:phosphoglycerate dehydrogenase-like enzyme
MAAERAGIEAFGATWSLVEDRTRPPAELDRADVLVVNSKVRVTDAVLAAFAGRCVLTTTSGHDHVDVEAARRRGVTVGRCPRARRDAVVEHAVGAMIGLMRAQPVFEAAARDGRWVRPELPRIAPRGLSGATVVVVGLGVIGQHATRVLEAFGARVRGVDPGVDGAWTIDDALVGADALTLHCALTPTSRGLLSATRLATLGAHAVVVNTARGECLDLDAAVDAVAGGRLRGVASDVFPVEPYPRLASQAAVPGVWLSPHSAGFTHDLGARVASEVIASVAAWIAAGTVPSKVA